MFLYFSVILLVDLHINPFRPSQSRSATASQSFRFSVKMFSRSTLSEGSRNRSQRARPPQPCTSHNGCTALSRPGHSTAYMLRVISTKCCFPLYSLFARRQMPWMRVRCQSQMPRTGVSWPEDCNTSEYSDFSKASNAYLLSTWRTWCRIAFGTFQVRIHSAAIRMFGQELPQLTQLPLTNIPVVICTSVRRAADV
jgi:hypothetical protein